MRRRAEARVGERHLVLVLLHVLDQRLEIVRRQVLLRDERHRHVDDLADVLEVLERLERQRAVERRRRRHADMREQQRVAVGARVFQLRRGDRARPRRERSRRRSSGRDACPSLAPSDRATVSVGPPAANGTISEIGFVGYCCAAAVAAKATAAGRGQNLQHGYTSKWERLSVRCAPESDREGILASRCTADVQRTLQVQRRRSHKDSRRAA